VHLLDVDMLPGSRAVLEAPLLQEIGRAERRFLSRRVEVTWLLSLIGEIILLGECGGSRTVLDCGEEGMCDKVSRRDDLLGLSLKSGLRRCVLEGPCCDLWSKRLMDIMERHGSNLRRFKINTSLSELGNNT
jgi:hypothetical protein